MRISILLFIGLIFTFEAHSQSSSEQIEHYSELLSEDGIDSETLWASTVLYHNLSPQDQEDFIGMLTSKQISEILTEASSLTSILNLSTTFQDEYLLLAYLLNQSSSELREVAFHNFYESSNKNNIKELNNSAVIREEIDSKIYENADLIVLFLLDNYGRSAQVIDNEFEKIIIDRATDNVNLLKADNLKKELFLAAYFNALYNNNRFQKLSDLYSEFKKMHRFPISIEKRNLFWGLDYVMYSLGQLDRSLEIQREFSLPLSDYLGDESGLHAIYSSHGGYLYMLGKYREAREVFESTLQRSENLGDQNLTRLYNNLSLVYFSTGESGKYIETQLKALEHAQSYQDYDHQISIYRNLHIFYRKNQNFELASTYIDRAADLAEEIDNREDLISILISKSVFESSYLGNINQADHYLKIAEGLIDDDLSNRNIIRVLSERADLLKTQNKYAESREIWRDVADLALSISNTPIYLESLVQAAELNIVLKNYSEAAKLLRDFRSHDISVVDFSVLTLSRMLQAMLFHHEGQFAKAEDLFAETSKMVLERARYSADHETGYWTIESEYMQLFETYADFLIDRNLPEHAVQLLDKIKTINDASLLQNPLITSTQLTEEELSRDRQITREMETLRRKLFITTGADRLHINNQLERLQAQKRELFRNQQAVPDQLNEIPLWSIQRTLNKDQVMIHVTSINDSYYVSRITRNSTDIEKIKIDDELKNAFESAVKGMITGQTDLKQLYKVGQILNLHTLADSYSSLIVVPDGYLHQLPLDVIPLNEPATEYSYGATTFLIEKMDVRTLNRLSDVRLKRQNREFEYDFTGFGVADFQNSATNRTLMPLPQAPDEVLTIEGSLNRFPKRTSFIGSAANPQRFKDIAGKSRILHMATHSEISESDPLFSRLHLLPSDYSADQSNQIFAYELFDLDLNNELIMLNSCESGGDRAIQGGGIMGLSRALHYAGAQSLILNAWSVNDQFAADFAEMFYQHINNGESKSRALQLTKIEFIKDKNANPHFWGPYILNGNNQPLIQKQGANLGKWLIAIIFIAGFILVSKTRHVEAAA